MGCNLVSERAEYLMMVSLGAGIFYSVLHCYDKDNDKRNSFAEGMLWGAALSIFANSVYP